MATKKQRSLREILGDIEILKVQADALRAAELSKVVADIKTSIERYGLTATDLGLGSKAGEKPGSKRTGPQAAGQKAGGRKSKALMVKFRDEQGNTWVGRGKRPDWFNAALAAGKSPDDLLAK